MAAFNSAFNCGVSVRNQKDSKVLAATWAARLKVFAKV